MYSLRIQPVAHPISTCCAVMFTRGWCAFQSSLYALLADRFPATLRHGQLAAQRHEEASASRLRGYEHGGLAAVDRAPPDTWTSSASPPLVER
jgi:hypothetical protein